MKESASPPATVIFEEISSSTFSLIEKTLQSGQTVYYFSVEENIKKSSRFKTCCATGRLLDAYKITTDYLLSMEAGSYAHSVVDDIYSRYISRSKSIEIAIHLFGSSELTGMYKKALLADLHQVFHRQLLINKIASKTHDDIVFYPAYDLPLYGDKTSFLAQNVVIIDLPFRNSLQISLFKKLKDCFYQFYPGYLLVKKTGLPSLTKTKKKSFILGINANLPFLFGYNHHYIDFIVDEIYGFPKQEIVFVDERFQRDADISFTEHGFSSYSTLYQRETLSIKFFVTTFLMRFIPKWIHILLITPSEKSVVLKVNRTILSDFVKWNLFCECYELDKHVTILLEDTISKNLILNEHGIKTWYIYPDNYTLDYHTGWDEKKPVSSHAYTFMMYDFAVVFGKKTQRYLSSHRNSIKKFFQNGVLSAQRIRELRQGKIPSRLSDLIKQKQLTGKIIGVFDTSFVDYGPLKEKDGIQFGESILQLLEDLPEICVIFKEKKFLSHTPGLAPVYERLEKHPRCLVVRKTESDCIFAPEVIAVSELVISAAYTSTTVEALSSRTKAIYYDVCGRDLGENYYFNRFPNLVSHDYNELKENVVYWLNEVNPDYFDNYLKKYVLGEIDAYLDMRSIDRLQQHLRTDSLKKDNS